MNKQAWIEIATRFLEGEGAKVVWPDGTPIEPPVENRTPLSNAEIERAVNDAHMICRDAVRKVEGRYPPMMKIKPHIVPGVPSSRPHRYKLMAPHGGGWAGAYIDGPWQWPSGAPVPNATYHVMLAGREDGLYTPEEKSAIRGNLIHEYGHAYAGYYHDPRYDIPGWDTEQGRKP